MEIERPTYRWYITGGTIISGQGTPNIETTMENIGSNLTVTVAIGGLPPKCVYTASETVMLCPGPLPSPIDELTGQISKVPAHRFEYIFEAAKSNPNAVVYIVISSGTGAATSVRQKKKELLVRLSSRLKNYSRVTYVVSDRKDDKVKIWLVPAGADVPKL